MAYDYSFLKGRIKEKVDTQNKFADKMGISITTLSMKLNNKYQFTQDEIARSIDILQIPPEEVCKYFFA